MLRCIYYGRYDRVGPMMIWQPFLRMPLIRYLFSVFTLSSGETFFITCFLRRCSHMDSTPFALISKL